MPEIVTDEAKDVVGSEDPRGYAWGRDDTGPVPEQRARHSSQPGSVRVRRCSQSMTRATSTPPPIRS